VNEDKLRDSEACDVTQHTLWQHIHCDVAFVDSLEKDMWISGNANFDSLCKFLLDRACLAGP